MPNIGFPELVVILVIVLLLFGPKKLPDFARSMGQAIREFRKASQEVVEDFHRAASEDPAPTRPKSIEAQHYEEAAAHKAEDPPKAPEHPDSPAEPAPTKQL